MLLVDDLAAGGTKNLRHTPRGLVTLPLVSKISINFNYIFSQFERFLYQTFQTLSCGITNQQG